MVLFIELPLLVVLGLWWLPSLPCWGVVAFSVCVLLHLGYLLSIQNLRYFFASDGSTITYRVVWGLRRVRRIPWREVTGVRLGPAYIRFTRRGRRPKRIALGMIPYQPLRDLKAEVARECRRIGVPCQVVRLA